MVIASVDFIQWLGQDMSVKILLCLEDPSDLVRVGAVSSSWRHFVIANGLWKQLCQKMFPRISSFDRVIEVKNMAEPSGSGADGSEDWSRLEKEHKAYASLFHSLTSFTKKSCLSDAICASSTDNYPQESIKNTLEPSDRVDHRASYWSSKGAANPAAPETLLYKLAARLCVITEVRIQPFQAYFQFGFPIYSAKAVRFHLGHPKVPLMVESDDGDNFLTVKEYPDDKFVWTYTSPEFPMTQKNCLQEFKLPEPVLSIGGILKVELLGRVQTQEMDGLYYICIANVQVIGSPLSPAFDVKMLDDSGKWTLEYYPEVAACSSPTKSPEAESSSPSRFHRFSASIRSWEQMILNTFRGAGHVVIDNDDDDEDSDDEYEYLAQF